jgi:hypothetical protein
MSKAITELIRDANRCITPADRHAILDLIEQQADEVAELKHEAGFTKPVDAADATYPNALGVSQTLRRCKEDLHTEARFVLWQARRIAELEALLVKANDAWLAMSKIATVAPAVDAQPVAEVVGTEAISWVRVIKNGLRPGDKLYASAQSEGLRKDAIRREALEEAAAAVRAEQLADPTDSPDDIAYDLAVRDCAAAIRALSQQDPQ